MSNNLNHILSMRAQTLARSNSENSNNIPTNNDFQPVEYDGNNDNEPKVIFTPLNICLLVTTCIILFLLFLLIVIYK